MRILRKYRGKITAIVVILLLLVASYVWGGNTSVNDIEKKPQNELSEKSEALISSTEAQISPDYNLQKTDDDKAELTDIDHPEPMPPQTAEISDKKLTCTLSIRCDSILKNMELLDKEKTVLIPDDGIILEKQQVTFYEGESVFDVLLREMKQNRIHFEYVNTPIYNSAYIEGISNIYEFDCGELSGWMYKVNEWFPNYGCSQYQLKDGDRIEWIYTCDLGKDIGGNNMN